MKREKIIKYLTVLIMIFVMILNMLRNTSVYNYKIFNISLLELFWITLVSIPFILTIIKKKKHYVYLILLIVYLLLHSVNITRFNQSIFPLSTINIFKEIYYILRIYILPLMFLYVLLENKDVFNKEFYCKISKIVISVIHFQY